MSRWFAKPLPGDRRQGNRTHYGRNWFEWPIFDGLPKLVKDVMNYAPVELGCGRAYEALRAGGDVQAVARQEVQLARRFSREETIHDYGPDHPSLTDGASDA